MSSALNNDFHSRDFKEELHRLASFSSYEGPVHVLELASQGFYYKGTVNEIECFSCHKSLPIISLRRVNRDLLTHRELHLPDCTWHQQNKNVPLYSRTTVDLRRERLSLCGREPGTEIDSKPDYSANISVERIDSAIYSTPGSLELAPTANCPCQRCTVTTNARCCLYVKEPQHLTMTRSGLAKLAKQRVDQAGIAYRDFTRAEDRIRSFEMSPDCTRATMPPIVDLAEAGFYYTGHGDNVRCYYCGCDLRNWDRRSCPWREHARWFPWCPHLQRDMGARYIHDILQMTKRIRDGHEGRNRENNVDVDQNTILSGNPLRK